MNELRALPRALQKAQKLASGIEASAQSRSSYWICCLSVVYFFVTLRLSLGKPLWFDELFTYYISQSVTFKQVIQAARFDGNPPGLYLVTHLAQGLLGPSDLASRIPQIIAYWILCLCLFLFVRRYFGGITAMLAFVFPLTPSVSPFLSSYAYAVEARPYALVFGFGGLALASWQRTFSNANRFVPLLGLALSVAFATGFHYFALIQVVLPLALGQLVLDVERKRVDFGVWAALSSAALPPILLFPELTAASGIFSIVRSSAIFWAKPTVAKLIAVFPHLLSGAAVPALFGIAAVFVVRFRSVPVAPTSLPHNARMPAHVLATAFGFLLVPLVIFLVARFRTGYFLDRYCASAIIGVTLLGCQFTATSLGDRFAAAFIIAQTVLTLGYAVSIHPIRTVYNSDSFMVPADNNLSLVVADPVVFLPIARYGAKSLISNAVYLTDLSFAFKKKDFLPEYSLNGAKSLFPLRIQAYSDFVASHDRFWLFSSGQSELEWLPTRLVTEGWHLQLRKQMDRNSLYFVNRQ